MLIFGVGPLATCNVSFMGAAMDNLDKEIKDKELVLEGLVSQVAMLEGEIAILRRASSLRPASPSFNDERKEGGEGLSGLTTINKRRGKPSGAISQEWRKILAFLSRKATFSFENFSSAAIAIGITASEPSKKARLKIFVSQKHILGNDIVGYTVSQAAAKRFNLAELLGPPDVDIWDPRKVGKFHSA